jgi:dehydrodolichyl diphosphate syntase complex subunit NUS1
VRCSQDIRRRVGVWYDLTDDETADSDIEYPLTPPLSDHSDSIPFSEAQLKRSVDGPSAVIINMAERKMAKRKTVQKRRRPQRKMMLYLHLTLELDYFTGHDEHALTNTLTLHIASRESSKPTVASVARTLARTQSRRAEAPLRPTTNNFNLSINALNSLLEGS